MTRFPDDPEVLADLRRREASDGDRGRSRNDPGAWRPPAVVEQWPCGGCGQLVGMTRDAIDTWAMFNRQLQARRDRPLPKRGQCPACKRRDDELAQAQRRQRPDEAGKGTR